MQYHELLPEPDVVCNQRGSPPYRASRGLIGRMAGENQLWGQRRIQAELARLVFKVFARTRRQVHASSQRPEAITGLAAIPEAARIDHLGVRFLLRKIDPLSDILRLLRNPSR